MARHRSIICNILGQRSAIHCHEVEQGQQLGRLEGEVAGRSQELPGGHVLSVPDVSTGIVFSYCFHTDDTGDILNCL